MKRKYVLLLMSLALVGCAAVTPRYNTLTEKDNPEIAVRVFDVRGAEGTHTDDSDFGTLFAQHLAGSLQSSGYKAMVVDKDADINKFKYVVDGQFSQIEAGSSAKRFWVGMGAGAARMTISFKLMRVADNNVMGTARNSSSDLISLSEKRGLSRISAKLAKEFSEKTVSLIRTDEQNY